MAESKSLKTAVKKEVKEASEDAKTGNVKTTDAPAPAPKEPKGPVDLPTGARAHPPGGFPR